MPDRATRTEPPRPPDFGPAVHAWRRTGIGYLLLGIAILVFGGGLLVYAMLDGKGDDFAQITKLAGGLITVTSLQVFNMSRKRFERIGIVETLRLRWTELAASKGSERQLDELNRMVMKLLKDNLSLAI